MNHSSLTVVATLSLFVQFICVSGTCTGTVSSPKPNGEIIYAIEDTDVTLHSNYEVNDCTNDEYYRQWTIINESGNFIVVQISNSATYWGPGLESQFSLVDDDNLIVRLSASGDGETFEFTLRGIVSGVPIQGTSTGTATLEIAIPPSITRHPSNKSTNEGTSSATLSCQADGNPTPTFTWTKDGSDLQSNSKYTLTGGSLVIHNIVRDDDGQYRCVSDNGYGTAATSNPATLTVNYPPGEPTCTRSPSPHSGTPSYYLINTGVTLTCQATDGKPTATVQWYKNEESSPLSSTQSVNGNTIERTYDFSVGKSDNTATYTCKATNTGLPNPLECELTLTVYFPPTSVTISGPSSDIKEDQTLTLTCTTRSSNPTAEISWYKNGSPWSSGNGESTNTVQDSNGEHNGKERTQELDIILKPSHNGARYQCKARNSYYSTNEVQSGIKELTVYYTPYVVNATENSRSAANEGDPALLICEVNCNPAATFKWYKDGNEVVDRKLSTIETKKWTVSISKLLIPFTERSDHGEYTCQAVNEIGNVNFSIMLEAKSKPEAPVGIELLSRSYDSLTIEIIPGFHGGEPDNIVYYVEYSESTQSDWQPWPSNGQGSRERQLTVTGLMENTLYVLKAKAGNSLGIGFYSTENTFAIYGKPVVKLDATSGILSWTLHENPDFVCIQVEVLVDTGDWIVENECVDAAITEYTVNHKSLTYRIVYCTLRGICEQTQFYATSEEVKNGKSSNTGLLAGTITTVIVVIAVVVLLVILLKCRHNTKQRGEDTELTGVELEAKPYEVIRPKDLKDDDIEVQYEDISKEHKKSQLRSEKVDLKVLSDETSYADLSTTRAEGMYMKLGEKVLEFPRNNLKVDSIIYNGMFHRIAKGKALNIGGKEGIIKVAIKMSRDDNIGNNEGDILNEIELLKSMSGHQNIINLLGCCTKTAPHYLIMPYFTLGNLKVFMKDNRQFVRGDPGGISSRQLMSFACDVAKGMEYLSDNNVVHRYLAAEHVMVENSLTCKISQFGYASTAVDVARLYEKMQDKTPNGWMAPESILKKEFSTCSDVWSFAVVVWEIVSLGLTPFEGIGQASIASKIKKGSTLPRQNQCGPELNDMMVSCWNRKPEHRPTFHALVDIVKGFVNGGKEHIDIQRIVESEYASVI
ncbi:fibroblast growth factor receptor 2-like [Glandiceps talaboti]